MVGLCLSFRGSTAYERYNEGRKYWAQLSSILSCFARLVWINVDERPESATEDLLAKISFCNMLVSLAVALKHRMRFEPFTHYDDLSPRVQHLKLIAHEAEKREWTEPSAWKHVGMLLGLPMAESNPRKLIKNPKKPLGNAPLEVHSMCADYVKQIVDNGTFKVPACQTQAYNMLQQITDVLSGSDRVLNTPLPLAYSIALGQITWVYILILPFQLVNKLGWVTIPGAMFAAYIILGLALIGREIENPFGEDVNDLALDDFCNQIEHDISLIMTHVPGSTAVHFERPENNILAHLASGRYEDLLTKSPEFIRARLNERVSSSS